MPKANILWIMTDQHQASCLGCMGNEIIQTPNLDRLADEGVLFENAFCQSPVCMASRASVFTGRYPSTVRVHGMGILPPQETTFPEWVQRHGYTTGGFGKLHLTPEVYIAKVLQTDMPNSDWHAFAEHAQLGKIAEEPAKENYGFQEFLWYEDILKGNHRAWIQEQAPELLDKEPVRFEHGPGDLYVSQFPSEYHPSTFIANNAADYIRSRSESDDPWMTFCSFVAPHHPFEAPEDQLARYKDEDMPFPSPEICTDIKDGTSRVEGGIGEFQTFPEDIQRMIIKHYYASISLIDDCVGSLIQTLEDTGQRDNTLIIFCADHGEHLGNHGLIRKTSFHYDEIVQVPLIMNLPGKLNSRRVGGLVELTDVYPTLLGLMDLPCNPGVQGIDWSEALLEKLEIGREDIYSDMYNLDPMTHDVFHGFYDACQTLRTSKWKLNVYPDGDLENSQLFDLKNDPDETRNLFHDPACREIREQMLWRMTKRVHANRDPLPLRLTQF